MDNNDTGATGQAANFMQTVPDSHFWTSIGMLLNYLKHYSGCQIDVDYLITGLNNTLKNGYDLAKAATPSVENQIQKQHAEKGNQLSSIVGSIPDLAATPDSREEGKGEDIEFMLEDILKEPGEWNDKKQAARRLLGEIRYPGMKGVVKSAAPVTDKGESGIKEFDDLITKYKDKEINFTQLTSYLWNQGYKAGTEDTVREIEKTK